MSNSINLLYLPHIMIKQLFKPSQVLLQYTVEATAKKFKNYHKVDSKLEYDAEGLESIAVSCPENYEEAVKLV